MSRRRPMLWQWSPSCSIIYTFLNHVLKERRPPQVISSHGTALVFCLSLTGAVSRVTSKPSAGVTVPAAVGTVAL